MVIKLVAEQAKRAGDRRRRQVEERAETFAAVEIDDLLKRIEKARIALALLNALQHCGKYVRFHAARRTLTAGFAFKELRDAKRFFDHARVFGIKAHHTTTETRTCPLQRFRIKRNVELIGSEKRARW